MSIHVTNLASSVALSSTTSKPDERTSPTNQQTSFLADKQLKPSSSVTAKKDFQAKQLKTKGLSKIFYTVMIGRKETQQLDQVTKELQKFETKLEEMKQLKENLKNEEFSMSPGAFKTEREKLKNLPDQMESLRKEVEELVNKNPKTLSSFNYRYGQLAATSLSAPSIIAQLNKKFPKYTQHPAQPDAQPDARFKLNQLNAQIKKGLQLNKIYNKLVRKKVNNWTSEDKVAFKKLAQELDQLQIADDYGDTISAFYKNIEKRNKVATVTEIQLGMIKILRDRVKITENLLFLNS